MLQVRVVKTKVGTRSVQICRYENGRRVIVRHVGTGRDDSEVASLRDAAQVLIGELSRQLPLFQDLLSSERNQPLSEYEYRGFHYTFLYEVIAGLQSYMGYDSLLDPMLKDLVVMRIVEPTSKLRSIELMETFFGIRHRRQRYYESARSWLSLKEAVERQTLHFARSAYGFDFSLLFYDVTTLYFETFDSDDLRKTGFSKDSKSQQPQILVALMVTKDGFPVAYEVFSGNTFEGHTMLPFIESFIRRHDVRQFTVVADAAMISSSNVEALRDAGISYIVGARLGNVSNRLLERIDSNLPRVDGSNIRLPTDNGFLVCSFSQQRYRKDRHEMEKQVEKARMLLGQPSKATRVKFLKTEGAKTLLNEELMAKATKLLGVKGYYTDIDESVADNRMIMERYHELYRIEQAFRVSKSDLKTRPIFHFKEEPIRLHLLVCFMALAISKHIEIRSGMSIRAFLTECRKVSDAIMHHKVTKRQVTMRSQIPQSLKETLELLNRPH